MLSLLIEIGRGVIWLCFVFKPPILLVDGALIAAGSRLLLHFFVNFKFLL